MVELLRTKFVPYALDNVQNPNLTPAEREFLDGFDSGVKACTIGMSCFTADGKKLSSGGSYEPKGLLNTLKKGLAEFKPETVSATVPPRDEATTRAAPAGGLVLYVTWKLIADVQAEGSATTANGQYDKVFQGSLGSDRLWVRKDESEALARGELLESLKSRMLRYHVQYVMGKEAKSLDVALRGGRIEGSIAVGDRQADALGFVAAKDGKVTRFEFMVRGWGRRVEDHGFSACLSVVPKGATAPAAILFELADPQEGLAAVHPHRVKEAQYLK